MNKYKPSKQKKIWIISLSGVIAVAFILWLAYIVIPKTIFSGLTNYYMPNYARETARPLEETFVGAGGEIISSGGDAGRGPDNYEPYYDVTLDVPLDEEAAIVFINDVSSNNGYKLTHASPTDKGQLEDVVSDEYINEWFFDDTSVVSQYNQLEQGNVELAFHVGDKDIKTQDGHTILRLNLRLPRFKQ